MALVDVVVVSYNSRPHLRACIEPLAGVEEAHVIVVDNASTDGSLESIADLPVTRIPRADNGGFAKGCNAGWSAGQSPFVLFLNPDAVIEEASLRRLARPLQEDEGLGAAAPRTLNPDGSLAFSQRRFPRLRSTYARALFLYRFFPRASWTDEVVRNEAAYQRPGSPDWVSGSCILVRRAALEELGGWDERFFLYGEDVDLCRRLWNSGRGIRYEPDAVVMHHQGASAPAAKTLGWLVVGRIEYARKHRSPIDGLLDRIGVALEALVRVVVSRGGLGVRAANARSLGVVLSRSHTD